MTQTRILELGQPDDSPRIARRKTIVELLCSVVLGAFASWAAVGAIEWASHVLAGR
jgi:hypothetical protein